MPNCVLAQQHLLMQVLGKKYDIVLPTVRDGLILVNNGGRFSGSDAAFNGKSGYVDEQGTKVIPLIYDYAEQFQNGYAVVAKRESDDLKYGLIDRTGREITPFEWDNVTSVCAGAAIGVRGEAPNLKCFLIDTTGKVTPLAYNYNRTFSNGYAVVGTGKYQAKEDQPTPGVTMLHQTYDFVGKHGYIAPDGTLAIPLEYDDARDFADDGLAAVAQAGQYYSKWGFINKKGEVVVPCKYYDIQNFNGDRAMVSKVVSGKLVYGYLDRAGAEVIPCQYDMATSFRFENTWIGIEKAGEMQYMLIDQKGNAVMGLVFDLNDSGKFGQATAAIRDGSGRLRYGILDIKGKVLLPFEYDQISLFSELDPQTGHWVEAAMATKNGEEFSFDITKK